MKPNWSRSGGQQPGLVVALTRVNGAIFSGIMVGGFCPLADHLVDPGVLPGRTR